MTALKNHPKYWLRADAAAAFDKAEDERGILQINSAGRTEAEQQALIDRWNAGGTGNRPPYLYMPAMPASSSNHVKDGGIAVDLADYKVFMAYCADYGFKHTYPGSDPVHFDFVGVPTGGNPSGFSQVTEDRQNWLISQGYNLGPSGADGIPGPATEAAYKAYQTFLKAHWGYTGAIDGVWGSGTQTAHQKYYDSLHTVSTPVQGNPFGISDVRGLQKVAKLYGYTGAIDNIWGSGSATGFTKFLIQNYGYRGNIELGPVMWSSIAKWLRAKWGYVGNDTPGPVMRSALVRANTANWQQLK